MVAVVHAPHHQPHHPDTGHSEEHPHGADGAGCHEGDDDNHGDAADDHHPVMPAGATVPLLGLLKAEPTWSVQGYREAQRIAAPSRSSWRRHRPAWWTDP